MNEERRSGLLRIVATPLGNLGDLSPRAREALESADCVVAEDTRRSGLLLQKMGIAKKPFVSYYAGKGERSAPQILERLRQGQTIVLVTDAGTPGISDPGNRLLQNVHQEGIRVECVPGPSAVAMALSVSSLGGGPFVFEGFLPTGSASRRRRLVELGEDTRPFVLYEAPHRARELLEDVVTALGAERLVTLVREGTKLHEEIAEMTAAALLARLPEKPLGEFTLVVAGASVSPNRLAVDPIDLVRFGVDLGLSTESAARAVADRFSVPRSRLLRAAKETEGDSGGEKVRDAGGIHDVREIDEV